MIDINELVKVCPYCGWEVECLCPHNVYANMPKWIYNITLKLKPI